MGILATALGYELHKSLLQAWSQGLQSRIELLLFAISFPWFTLLFRRGHQSAR